MERLESEIAEWRAFIERSPAVDNGDIEELEAHLRDQIIDLKSVGLASDEAFLIAVKRMGSVDELSREFAHSRLLYLGGRPSKLPPGIKGSSVFHSLSFISL
jgi:hypothetical protein